MVRVVDSVERSAHIQLFSDLFRAEFRRMVALAQLLGADDPQDIAQDAFARLHSRGTLDDSDAAVGYLRRWVSV